MLRVMPRAERSSQTQEGGSLDGGSACRAFLAAVRGRLRKRQAWGNTLVWLQAVGVALLLVLGGAGIFGPSPWWRLMFALLVAGALLGLVRLSRNTALAWKSDDVVARFIGGRVA